MASRTSYFRSGWAPESCAPLLRADLIVWGGAAPAGQSQRRQDPVLGGADPVPSSPPQADRRTRSRGRTASPAHGSVAYPGRRLLHRGVHGSGPEVATAAARDEHPCRPHPSHGGSCARARAPRLGPDRGPAPRRAHGPRPRLGLSTPVHPPSPRRTDRAVSAPSREPAAARSGVRRLSFVPRSHHGGVRPDRGATRRRSSARSDVLRALGDRLADRAGDRGAHRRSRSRAHPSTANTLTEVVGAIASLDAFVGTPMHSDAVLDLSICADARAVLRAEGARVLSQIAMQRWALPLDSLYEPRGCERLAASIEQLWAERHEIRRQLEDRFRAGRRAPTRTFGICKRSSPPPARA